MIADRRFWTWTTAACGWVALAAWSIALAAQTFSLPVGRAENVRTMRNGSVYTLTYDLAVTSGDAASAVFDIQITVRVAGQAVVAKSVTGDVSAVRPGKDRRILWDAGQDVETRNYDQFTFDVSPVGGRLIETPGRLRINSSPAGAAVLMDGKPIGVTPFDADVASGPHQIALRLTGYAERSENNVTIRAGETSALNWSLTAITASPASAPGPAAQPPSVGGGGGGPLRWILIGGGGAGAAAAAALLRGKGTSTTTVPPGCTFSLSPSSFNASSAAAASTQVSISVSPTGCANPNWSATGGTFFAVTPLSGSGNGTVTVSVSANNTGSVRNDTLSIASQSFQCSQPGINCTYSGANYDGEPQNLTACPGVAWSGNLGWCVGRAASGPGGGSPRGINIISSDPSCPWTATVDVPWVHLTPGNGMGTSNNPFPGTPAIRVDYDQNTTGSVRMGTVTVTGSGGTPIVRYTIGQRPT